MRWMMPIVLAACVMNSAPDKADCCAEKVVAGAPSPTPTHVITIPIVEVVSSKLLPRHVLIVGDSEACVIGQNRDAIAKFNDDNGQPHDVVDVECKTSTRVTYWGYDGNFRAALSKHPNPDEVLVFLGTNHWWNDRKAPEVKPILDLVDVHQLKCIWVGNTAVRGKRWPINDLLRAAVTPTCDYFDTEAAEIPLRDGVHPGREGAVKWINAVWSMIPLKYEDDAMASHEDEHG